MSHYAELDRLILDRIGDTKGGTPLTYLHARAVRVEASRLADAFGRDDFRIVDGRLQALRKAGKIRFDSKSGWHLGAAMQEKP